MKKSVLAFSLVSAVKPIQLDQKAGSKLHQTSQNKNEIIPIIKWLAIDLFEVVFDIQLVNGLLFNTIEWRKDKNKVYLHKIVDDLDYQFDFDDFDEETKKEIYYFLMRNFLNQYIYFWPSQLNMLLDLHM